MRQSNFPSRTNKTSKKTREKQYDRISRRKPEYAGKIDSLLKEYGLATLKELGKYTKLKNKYKRVLRNYSETSKVYQEVYKKLCDYGIIDPSNYMIGQVNEKSLLQRRFCTILYKKYNLPSAYAARQKIIAGFAYFKGQRRKICSFLVKKQNEKYVTLKDDLVINSE